MPSVETNSGPKNISRRKLLTSAAIGASAGAALMFERGNILTLLGLETNRLTPEVIKEHIADLGKKAIDVYFQKGFSQNPYTQPFMGPTRFWKGELSTMIFPMNVANAISQKGEKEIGKGLSTIYSLYNFGFGIPLHIYNEVEGNSELSDHAKTYYLSQNINGIQLQAISPLNPEGGIVNSIIREPNGNWWNGSSHNPPLLTTDNRLLHRDSSYRLFDNRGLTQFLHDANSILTIIRHSSLPSVPQPPTIT